MADNEPKKRRSGAKNSRKRKGTQRGLTLLNQKKPDDQVSKKSSARSFPASTFEEALVLAQGIQQFAAGQRVRRLTLFDNFGKSPDSGPSRQLVTNSSKYGLTKGSYGAEYLELTEDGRTATSQDVPARTDSERGSSWLSKASPPLRHSTIISKAASSPPRRYYMISWRTKVTGGIRWQSVLIPSSECQVPGYLEARRGRGEIASDRAHS
jgi:hypothetical protein